MGAPIDPYRERRSYMICRKSAEHFRNNVGGTISLLDAARAAGVPRLVFSSTCATCERPERISIDEDHGQEPINPYGASKLFVSGQ